MLKVALALAIALAVVTGSPVTARQQVPAASLAKLQDIFSDVRDQLWVTNDGYWHHGEYERCIAMLRLIVEIDPHDIEAYSGGAWLMQNQLRDDQAEAFLRRGLKDNSDTYDLYFELGYFCYMHERFAEAISYLESAVTLEAPGFVWNMLAHSCEHSGDWESAFAIWTQKEALDPADPVPGIQIERMLSGEPPSNAPERARQSREHRLREKAEHERGM